MSEIIWFRELSRGDVFIFLNTESGFEIDDVPIPYIFVGQGVQFISRYEDKTRTAAHVVLNTHLVQSPRLVFDLDIGSIAGVRVVKLFNMNEVLNEDRLLTIRKEALGELI